ncbi:6-phosphofructokinase [Enterococcus sp.]|uniref:6-phosphofructokinase n=1 Tax=Enterococcus sp. TaxID=35783 RepID=UPI00289FBE92|nr:6-phosphofructokinase [Enterococcus sp.]
MKIAVICSGGDSPGMNSALLAIKKTIDSEPDSEVVFFKNGYAGIFKECIASVSLKEVEVFKAGTLIGTARFEKMRDLESRKIIIENLNKMKIDNLIVIGGNGSLKGAELLKNESELQVSVIPGTIDNDFPNTDYTLGFDSALNTIIRSIDDLTSTANAHDRIIIMEVMGRGCFALPEYASIANNTYWVERDDKEYLHLICKKFESEFYSPILLLPEGISNKQKIIEFITKNLPKETKYLNLAYLQRGSSPTFYDRYIGYLWGQLAAKELIEGKSGILSQKNGNIMLIPW